MVPDEPLTPFSVEDSGNYGLDGFHLRVTGDDLDDLAATSSTTSSRRGCKYGEHLEAVPG